MANSSVLAQRDPFKSDQVYDALRHRIRTLELAPGIPLRKEEIAAEFGVSRAPVSDAISRLAEEGLVEVYPQHGSFVAQLRAENIREGMFIRMALEVEVARRAAQLRDAALSSYLRDNIAGQEDSLASGNLPKLYALDEDMHTSLFSTIDMPKRAGKILEAARSALDRLGHITYHGEGRPEATVREHRCIVDAVLTGDPEFAASAMRAHLNAFYAVVETKLQMLDETIVP